MNKNRFKTHVLGFMVLLGLASCTTDFELNAPPKDIWVVFGVLNANDTVQYIRVSRAFLPESNALEYAREVDESVKGLQVKLSGGGQELIATEIDSVPKNPQDGTFFPYTTLYKLETAGSSALKGNERYDLEIRQPGIDSFQLQAYTVIPQPVIFDTPKPVSGAGQTKCLRSAALNRDYKVEFRRGNAASFEIRAFLNYRENGEEKMATFGPTPIFDDDFRCLDAFNTVCYNFGAYEILRSFHEQINPQFGNIYTYPVTVNTECNTNVEELPDAFRFGVTGIDSFLTAYNSVNSPIFADFNTVKPEYTNIRGTVETLGVFGSISTNMTSAKLNDCSLYLLQLNNEPAPNSPCEL
jgi:hypothetical protein